MRSRSFTVTLGGVALMALNCLIIYTMTVFARSACEAARRLKRLHADPGSDVRPMPVSFLESLFGLK